MKKKFAAYGLHDSRMVPLFRCSSTNLCTSAISSCVRGRCLPGNNFGALGATQLRDPILCVAVIVGTFVRQTLSCVFCIHWVVLFWIVHLLRVDGDTPYEVLISLYWAWYVLCSGSKDSFLCIVGAEDDRELGVINPPLFPIYLWLICHKP